MYGTDLKSKLVYLDWWKGEHQNSSYWFIVLLGGVLKFHFLFQPLSTIFLSYIICHLLFSSFWYSVKFPKFKYPFTCFKQSKNGNKEEKNRKIEKFWKENSITIFLSALFFYFITLIWQLLWGQGNVTVLIQTYDECDVSCESTQSSLQSEVLVKKWQMHKARYLHVQVWLHVHIF